MSTDSLSTLLSLMSDVEEGDPLDFGILPIDEQEARKLVAMSLLKMQSDLDAHTTTAAEREMVLMASAAHLVLENFLLHLERLIAQGHDASSTAAAVMARLRGS